MLGLIGARAWPRFLAVAFHRHELEIPQFVALAPAVGGTDLDRKIRGFDGIPTSHLIENFAYRREQAFANVLARELLALEDGDRGLRAILLQKGRERGSGWAAADDRDVDIDFTRIGASSVRGAGIRVKFGSRRHGVELHSSIRDISANAGRNGTWRTHAPRQTDIRRQQP